MTRILSTLPIKPMLSTETPKKRCTLTKNTKQKPILQDSWAKAQWTAPWPRVLEDFFLKRFLGEYSVFLVLPWTALVLLGEY